MKSLHETKLRVQDLPHRPYVYGSITNSANPPKFESSRLKFVIVYYSLSRSNSKLTVFLLLIISTTSRLLLSLHWPRRAKILTSSKLKEWLVRNWVMTNSSFSITNICVISMLGYAFTVVLMTLRVRDNNFLLRVCFPPSWFNDHVLMRNRYYLCCTQLSKLFCKGTESLTWVKKFSVD